MIVDARNLVRETMTMEITLTHVNEVRFRLWVAARLGALALWIGILAAWVAGCEYRVSEERPK